MTLNYRKIADQLAARITAGTWAAGSQLPTSKQVADEFGVSEATAYRALSLLVDRGLAYGEQGRGRFVGPPPDEG